MLTEFRKLEEPETPEMTPIFRFTWRESYRETRRDLVYYQG